MNISIEPINSCCKRIKVEVPLPHVQEKLSSITHQFQKLVKIPGFRIGHAPIDIIQKRYQADIEAELKEELIDEAYKFALKEKRITPVTAAKVEDLNYIPDATFSFSLLVECEPEFPLPQYKKLKLTKHDNTITEEQIDKVIEHYRSQYSTYHDINDRPLAIGDYAVLDYIATLNGQPLDQPYPETRHIAQKKNFWIHIEDGSFSIFPGFIHQCIGLEINQTRNFTIKLPEDFEPLSLSGQSLQFTVILKGIKKQELPPIDDAFAQKLKHDSLESLRATIRSNLQKARDNEISQISKTEIINKLISAIHFDLPESLLNNETQNIYEDIVAENRARGIPIATIEENHNKILTQAKQNAEYNVKAKLIINKISKLENIEPTQEEIYARILAIAEYYNTSPEKILKEIKKNRSFLKIINQITFEKTLDFILSQAIYE